jgi:hypothetical protein
MANVPTQRPGIADREFANYLKSINLNVANILKMLKTMNDLHQSELDKAARNDHSLDDLVTKQLTGGDKDKDKSPTQSGGVTTEDLQNLMQTATQGQQGQPAGEKRWRCHGCC